MSGPGWSSRSNLSVRYGELAPAVVVGLQPLEMSGEGLFDKARYRVLVRPAIEHGDRVLHAQQQIARDGHGRAFNLPPLMWCCSGIRYRVPFAARRV